MAIGFGNFGFEGGSYNKQIAQSNRLSGLSPSTAPSNYEDWARQESARLGTTNRDVINPEQYQLAQIRQQKIANQSQAANINLAAQGQAAASVADPWASQRPMYQASLRQLTQSPGAAMQNDPFFKWQQQQGEQAVNRAAAAQGQLRSGNRMTALSDYAQKQAGNQYFQLADLYSLLGGAKHQNPAAAAELMYTGARDAAKMGLGETLGGGGYSTDINMRGFRPGYFV